MGKHSRDYFRTVILALANLGKPFIISGKYYYNPKKKLDYVTYLGIKPYVPMGVSSREICDHINITQTSHTYNRCKSLKTVYLRR